MIVNDFWGDANGYGEWHYLLPEDWKAFVYWRWGLYLYSEEEEPVTTPIPRVYLKAFGEDKK